jgi:hypothetical protein
MKPASDFFFYSSEGLVLGVCDSLRIPIDYFGLVLKNKEQTRQKGPEFMST